jgi:hypothetical protein
MEQHRLEALFEVPFRFYLPFHGGHYRPDQPASSPAAGFVRRECWAWAKLCDVYSCFIAFICWVGWRERSRGLQILWFILIMTLGNIAMSLYVLLPLFPW